jgi:hypothetical protein
VRNEISAVLATMSARRAALQGSATANASGQSVKDARALAVGGAMRASPPSMPAPVAASSMAVSHAGLPTMAHTHPARAIASLPASYVAAGAPAWTAASARSTLSAPSSLGAAPSTSQNDYTGHL